MTASILASNSEDGPETPTASATAAAGAWIFGFVFGQILGGYRAAPWTGQFGWMELCALGMVGWVMASKLAVSTAGPSALVCLVPLAVTWGWAHSAPAPPQDVRAASVLATALGCEGRAPGLARTGDGVYSVMADRRTLAVASVVAPRRSGLFGGLPGKIRPSVLADESPGGLICAEVVEPAAAILREKMQRRGARLGPFFRRLLLGDLVGGSPAVDRSFKVVGAYHLLVVSGLHVSIIAWMICGALRMPALLAYSFRLISAGVWRWCVLLAGFSGIAGTLAYLLMTGATSAAQRACLLFVCAELGRLCFGVTSWGKRLAMAIVAQSLIFPLGFLSAGNLMSWLAYFLVVTNARRFRAGGVRALVAAFNLQLVLACATAAVFGQLAVLGCVANFFLVPAFPVLIGASLLALTGWSDTLTSWSLAMVQAYLAVVRDLAGLVDHFPWLYLEGDRLGPWTKVTMAVVATVAPLINLKDRSIKNQVMGQSD